jgi:REP element-mobilizing transposase RayT
VRRFHRRTHPRWKQYDYRLPGTYFVTTITLGRIPLLGDLQERECVLSPAGVLVRNAWRRIPEAVPGVNLDAFVVMPDHVHAVLVLPERAGTEPLALSRIVGWAKSRSAHEINALRGTPGHRVWQASFHDRIVRDAEALDRIRNYIESNPYRGWERLMSRHGAPMTRAPGPPRPDSPR